MKSYRSHKIVEAGQIASYIDNKLAADLKVDPAVKLDDGETIVVPGNFFSRGFPQIGDYLVRYDDGYLSWSPKKAFEEGYKAV